MKRRKIPESDPLAPVSARDREQAVLQAGQSCGEEQRFEERPLADREREAAQVGELALECHDLELCAVERGAQRARAEVQEVLLDVELLEWTRDPAERGAIEQPRHEVEDALLVRRGDRDHAPRREYVS